jgi:hypothetical protein
MSDNHAKTLESAIREFQSCVHDMSNSNNTEELLRIIHKPGFTTPAEFLLLISALKAATQHLEVAQKLHSELVRAAGQVGATRATAA